MGKLNFTYTKHKTDEFVKYPNGTCLLHNSLYAFLDHSWKRKENPVTKKSNKDFQFCTWIWNDFIPDSWSTLFLTLGKTCPYSVIF
jgi:hypothetical protein